MREMQGIPNNKRDKVFKALGEAGEGLGEDESQLSGIKMFL